MFSGGLEMDLKWINVLNVVLNMFKVTIKKPERRQLILNLFMLTLKSCSKCCKIFEVCLTILGRYALNG